MYGTPGDFDEHSIHGALIKSWGLQFICRVLGCGVAFSRCDCVGSLPLGGMDDGWTLDLWDVGSQTERVHARSERVKFVL